MKYILLFSIIHFFAFQLIGQTVEEKIYQQKRQLPKGSGTAEMSIILAKSFLGKPYKGGTLEGNEKEKLVCNLQEFDCSTFVENIVALALDRQSKESSFNNYLTILKKLRYEDATVDGYGSRLHYFREWMRQSEANGICQDISSILGGEKQAKKINFMSSNRHLYPSLQEEKAFLKIQAKENTLNKSPYFVIPKSKISLIENDIQDGDIIAIASNVAGLDYNHEGFAHRKNGRIYLLHASYEQKKIIISDETLSEYLQRIKKHAGISVLRLL